MNGFTNTFWLTNKSVVIFTPICDARKGTKNAMEYTIDVANCPIGLVLRSAHRWLSSESAWEIGKDTLLGRGARGVLVSLVERKSRFTLLQPVEQRLADLVSPAIISLLAPYPNLVHTITGDNGKEFANHVQIAEALKATFYFAHPYSAWERGTSENTNGLIRQYFPKKTDFSKITPFEAIGIALKLNHRPRKCLDFMTPFEVFFNQPVALTS